MGSGLATQRSEAGPRGEHTRRSAKGLGTAGKCGRDPAQDVDSALCLGIAQLWPDKMPYRSALWLDASLLKAQSSILTQVRTGKIGLAAFLCKQQVPDFPTPACSCGAQWETARHVVMDCPRLQRARCSLFAAASTTDYQVLISRPRPATALTAWILHHGVLSQFSWAQEQLAAGY